MIWTELDWPALDRLRERFLRAVPADGSYWQTESELKSYDQTYGERIGWKWDAVLQELTMRNWKPRSRSVVDWGCGTGVAARRVVRWLGADNISAVMFHDHSVTAVDFATAELHKEFPQISGSRASADFLLSSEPIGLLVVSHVLNELSAGASAELRAMLLRAHEIIWVESGTHSVSRKLGTIRDGLLPNFHLVSPCTHQNLCPMFRPENARHWCHFFARPPSEIFSDSNWVKFGRRAGIDLRSLPYAFFAAMRSEGAAQLDSPFSRIIGRPETFKPYARVLNCDASGLATLEVGKRQAPQLYKELGRAQHPLVYHWTRVDGEIVAGELPGPSGVFSSHPEVP